MTRLIDMLNKRTKERDRGIITIDTGRHNVECESLTMRGLCMISESGEEPCTNDGCGGECEGYEAVEDSRVDNGEEN